MPKALIVFASRAGATEKMANVIAEGLRISGVDTEVKNVTHITSEDDLKGYDAYLFGAATYHGDMLQQMKQMLFLAEKAGLKGKVGGAFGAFGWSGEAPDRIFGTMEHVFEMNVVSGPLRLKSIALQGGIPAAQDYGKQIAKKLTE